MRTIAIGPETNAPSWNWIGFDTARELSKYYDVKICPDGKGPPPCDAVLIIKRMPDKSFVQEAKRTGTKLIYCPVDFLRDERHLIESVPVLSTCDVIVSHCRRLSDKLRPHCSIVKDIDHHNKHMLPQMSNFRNKGYVLWIGGCQYVPYLLQWLKDHPTKQDFVILTNHMDTNGASVKAAHVLAGQMKMKLKIFDKNINGYPARQWCERNQYELMNQCLAGIDIKGADFNQMCKPPTKAQKFVASGIPFATNVESYSAEYLTSIGLKVAAPEDEAYWFSEEYWRETRRVGEIIRYETSLKTIGEQYRDIIESLFVS